MHTEYISYIFRVTSFYQREKTVRLLMHIMMKMCLGWTNVQEKAENKHLSRHLHVFARTTYYHIALKRSPFFIDDIFVIAPNILHKVNI